jgi:hypothetical protein
VAERLLTSQEVVCPVKFFKASSLFRVMFMRKSMLDFSLTERKCDAESTSAKTTEAHNLYATC